MNSQRLRLPVYEVNPSMRVDSLRGKRDTTRKDGGARNDLQVEIRDADDCAVWLRAEPEHGGGWYCCIEKRSGLANTLSGAVNDCIAGAGYLGKGPYTVTLTDIDGECHEGKGKTLAGAVNNAYAAHVYAQRAGKARGGA